MELPAKLTAMIELKAMSLEVPVTPGHPNKRPFSGVMTRIDEPSDGPVGGSGGRLVVVTRACAEAALDTLLGMAIDANKDLTNHAEARKIGIITEATIEGNAIVIKGHLFAKDFPAEMEAIDAEKHLLGFSYELTPTKAAITADNLLRIDAGYFTGAALLYKSKAAYHSTSLAAAATTSEDEKMDLKELTEAVAALTAAMTAQGTQLKSITEKLAASGVTASSECMAAVEPHAKALESCAAAMKAAGVGGHPEHGHVRVLHSMAGHMRASAALGKIPHIWRDHDYPMSAAAQTSVTAAVDPALKKDVETLSASLKTVTDSLAAITTGLADLKANARANTPAPERRTLPSSVTSLLARNGIGAPTDGDPTKVNVEEIAAKLKANGASPEDIMVFKNTVDRAATGRAA